MADVEHRTLGLGSQHILENWSYANEAARLAAAGLTSADVGKIAFQVDTKSYWRLVDDSPLEWFQVGNEVTQVELDAEATTRASADTTLQTNITAEATARANADTAHAAAADPHTGYVTDAGLAVHTDATTAAHGGIVASNDARLTDARTPTAHATTHVTGGSDVIASAVAGGAAGLMSGADKTKLDGYASDMATQAELDAHTGDTTDAHDATAVSFAPTGTVAATDVQAAIEEVSGDVTTVTTGLSDHLADAAAAHAATAIAVTPFSTIAATTVQAALEEIVSEAGGGGGAVVQIAETVLGSPAASITFSSIPGTYRSLMLVVSGRSTKAASDNDELYLRINGDTSANYDHQVLVTTGATSSTIARGTAQTNIHIGYLPAATAAAGNPGMAVIDIPNYAATTFNKITNGRGGSLRATGASFMYSGTGLIRSTSAITSLTVYTNSGNLDTGTVATLYGLD